MSTTVHQSPGRPGIDAGVAWSQNATLTFSHADPVSLASLPSIWLTGGTLRVGSTVYEDLIPIDNSFSVPIELTASFSNADGGEAGVVVIRAHSLKIEVSGDRLYAGEFAGYGTPDTGG